ncbi:MAG: hypothetical protein JWP66_628 [Naasia sp.]|nr:hypothetical protein [Naasia sp.]
MGLLRILGRTHYFPIRKVEAMTTNDEVLDPGMLLERSARLAAVTRAEPSPRPLAWLIGMAALMPVTFAGIGAARGEAGILAVALVMAAAVGVLSVALMRGRAVSVGFRRRFLPALLAWGASFGVLLSVGLIMLRGELLYWIPAGIVVGLPLAVAAWREDAISRGA